MTQAKKTARPPGRPPTKSRRAYARLRRMILAGAFAAENPWSLRSLAERFAMSVVPVSEAVRRLEQEGVLEVHPQRGIWVRRLSVPQLREVNVIREGLEVQAARLVAVRRRPEVLRKLTNLAQKVESLAAAGRWEQMNVADHRFHQALVAGAGLEMLTSHYEQLLMMAMIATSAQGLGFLEAERRGYKPHLTVVKALAGGDPDKAESAVRAHIASAASARS